MENASKALLIAAGIMLVMMILSVMIYMSETITNIGKAQTDRKAAEQLAAFNAEYEAYNKKLMYGTDVITVMNKAKQYNEKLDITETPGKNLKNITITIEVAEGYTADDITNNYKTTIFECIDIDYNEDNGKVNYMKFKVSPKN